jgi:hypothetical protein
LEGPWIKESDSPLAGITKDFGVSRTYPFKLHKKFIQFGSLADNWNMECRPKLFGSPVKKALLEIAEEQAEKQERASAPFMQKKLVQMDQVGMVPSEATIRRLKREMKFTQVLSR